MSMEGLPVYLSLLYVGRKFHLQFKQCAQMLELEGLIWVQVQMKTQ